MALIDGGIVALRDAKILADEAEHIEFGLLERTVGPPDAEKEVHHVVAGGVVGVDLDLRTDIDNGDVLLDHLLQHLEHLLALLLAIVLQEESLDEIHGMDNFSLIVPYNMRAEMWLFADKCAKLWSWAGRESVRFGELWRREDEQADTESVRESEKGGEENAESVESVRAEEVPSV